MRHLKFRKKRKRAPHKAKLHFLSEKIHWNKKAVALWIAEIAVVCALAFILVFYFGQRVSNACLLYTSPQIKENKRQTYPPILKGSME